MLESPSLEKEFKDITRNELEGAKQKLSSDIDKKKYTDTGKSKNMTIVSSDKKVELKGVSYFKSGLVTGFKGVFPNLTALRGWVSRKLNISEDNVNSVAFLVGRKIKEKGTTLYQGKRQAVIVEKVTKEVAKEVSKKLALEGAEIITKSIANTLNKRG